MRLPTQWRTPVVWGLATAAVGFFVAYVIVLHNEGSRARRWRNALLSAAIVAAVAAGIIQVSALVRGDVKHGSAAITSRYNPTATAVVMS